jgi:hypothetical protein
MSYVHEEGARAHHEIFSPIPFLCSVCLFTNRYNRNRVPSAFKAGVMARRGFFVPRRKQLRDVGVG